MTINLPSFPKITLKRILLLVVAVVVFAAGAYAGRWTYVRANAAALVFNYMVQAPEGSQTARAATLDKLIKDYEDSHKPTPPAK
jgi:hypothetical protein